MGIGLRCTTGVDTSPLERFADELTAGRCVPYLGSRVIGLTGTAPVPTTPEALAAALGAVVAVSGRIRTNLWATAQFIESRRHRKTLTALMAAIFAPPVMPTALHRRLAALPIPLIVDTWYDAAMRTALVDSGRVDWGEVQGVTRSTVYRDIWTRAYDHAGREVDPLMAASWKTVLYKPHGSIAPARNFLVSDSDYVEVLTEIDIQTPLPAVVKARRADRAFLFIGARFHDQLLRNYARQITKRSGGDHAAIVDAGTLTRNEANFLDEIGAVLIDVPLAGAVDMLCGGAPVA